MLFTEESIHGSAIDGIALDRVSCKNQQDEKLSTYIDIYKSVCPLKPYGRS